MGRLTVLAQPLGEAWVPFGTDRRRGVYVEDFQASSDSGGPLDASFMLRRTPRTYWPDLGYATPIKAYDDGMLVWGGRIRNSPGTDGDDRNVQVQCEGWQAHTDDRPYSKLYVSTDLGRWTDIRSNQNADLTKNTTAIKVSADGTGVTLTWPDGTPRAANTGNGVFFDCGPNQTAARVVISWSHSNTSSGTTMIFVVASSIAALSSWSGASNVVQLNTTPTGTAGFTLGTPSRYIGFFLVDNTGTPLTPVGVNIWCKLTALQVFSSTAYESGNASILKSSDVVLEALSRLQLISSDRSRIGTTSYALPAFSANDQTIRDVVVAANAFQDWQFRIREDRVPEYRARPSSPLLSLTDQSAFDDASAGSGESIYNEVTYTGTGPDGTPVVVTRTATAAGLPLTIPDRRVYTKAYVIQSSAPLTSAAASQLCDVFLSQRNRTPFKGTIHVSSRRAISLNPSGTPIPPSLLLRYGGEMCSFKHLQDPDTGALGRDGRVAQVTWTHASNSAEVAIDSSPYSFEAMFARLALATAR